MSEATLAHLPVADGPEANDAKQGSSPRFVHTSGVQAIATKDCAFAYHVLALRSHCRQMPSSALCLSTPGKELENEVMEMSCFAPSVE